MGLRSMYVCSGRAQERAFLQFTGSVSLLLHWEGTTYPLFHQSETSAGSGLVLALVWSWLHLRNPIRVELGYFSTRTRVAVEKHHTAQFSSIARDKYVLQVLLLALHAYTWPWHPNMTGPRPLLLRIGVNSEYLQFVLLHMRRKTLY